MNRLYDIAVTVTVMTVVVIVTAIVTVNVTASPSPSPSASPFVSEVSSATEPATIGAVTVGALECMADDVITLSFGSRAVCTNGYAVQQQPTTVRAQIANTRVPDGLRCAEDDTIFWTAIDTLGCVHIDSIQHHHD